MKTKILQKTFLASRRKERKNHESADSVLCACEKFDKRFARTSTCRKFRHANVRGGGGGFSWQRPPVRKTPKLRFATSPRNDGAGIDYRRVPSATNIIYEALKHQPTYTFDDLLATPNAARGSPV